MLTEMRSGISRSTIYEQLIRNRFAFAQRILDVVPRYRSIPALAPHPVNQLQLFQTNQFQHAQTSRKAISHASNLHPLTVGET